MSAAAARSPPCLVIAGAGDLGMRLATLRAAAGVEIVALRRRDVPAVPGVRHLRVDLATGEGFGRVPRRPDALVFCAAPEERDEAAYRALYVDGTRRLLDALQVSRLIFVSSTAVYAQDAGEVVDEGSPAEASSFNAQAMRDAEHELDAHAGGQVLRLSGLYGPGREMLLRRAHAGGANRPRWSNRIHLEDAATALAFLLERPAGPRLLLGSDDEPALECAVQDWMRVQLGLPPAAVEAGGQTGRRVCNGQLRALGWSPRYPDFRAGYASFMASAAS